MYKNNKYTIIATVSIIVMLCIGFGIDYYNQHDPNQHYYDMDVFVKDISIKNHLFKGRTIYDRNVVLCSCGDTTLCTEWYVKSDTEWYNLRTHQIKHFDMVRRDRFWRLK